MVRTNNYECCDCKHFEYDEYWDGENEDCYMICKMDRYNHVGWGSLPCEDFEVNEW